MVNNDDFIRRLVTPEKDLEIVKEVVEYMENLEPHLDPIKENIIAMGLDVKKTVEISEALVHSVPEQYYLQFTEDELDIIYQWAQSLQTCDKFFGDKDLQKYSYLMYDSKANAIHEHFLYKNSLLDRANFIREIEKLYKDEKEKETPNLASLLKILGMIQVERMNMDKVLAEYRKYMESNSDEKQDNLTKILKRVVNSPQNNSH